MLKMIFQTNALMMYERETAGMFFLGSDYFWSYPDTLGEVHGPFASVLAATKHHEALIEFKAENPTVILVDFVGKKRQIRTE